MADEQLAIMLQDEMFRKELQGAGLGGIFGGGGGGGSGGSGGSSGSNGNGAEGADAQVGVTGLPNMGILKGLSSLSEMSRRNLNNIAQKFRSRNSGGSTSTSESERVTEQVSLLHAQDEHDDDEEVIDFQAANKKNK